jgi:hypothetical protein
LKATRTVAVSLDTGLAVRLFHPRRDRWRDHFAWSGDLLRLEGLTEVGRTTVDALQLNREGLVNIRRALILVGAHPPPEDK